MSTLIKFAGHDNNEARGLAFHTSAKKAAKDATIARNRQHAIRAYNMFKSGRDTLDIAAEMGKPEPVILKWITIVRSARLSLPRPYPHRGEVE
jgi:hypothetical protein